MDNLNELGNIASIISLIISLGLILWSVIKRTKISGFNLYMLVMVLIQVGVVGYRYWKGETVQIQVSFLLLMVTGLAWGIHFLYQRMWEIVQSQAEIIKSLRQIVGDRTEDQENVLQSLWGIIDVIQVITQQLELNHENFYDLNEKIETVQKNIGKKKLTK